MGWPQLGFDRADAAQAGFDAGWWDIRMDAAVASQAHASGKLTVPKRLRGMAASTITVAGTLSLPKRLAVEAHGDIRAEGGLSVPKTLRGQAIQRDAANAALVSMVWPEDVDGYVRLITSQHVTRPRFMTMVKALTAQAVALQGCLQMLAMAFELDTAVGVQLDQVGEWIGVSRVLRVGLTGVYFSFDAEGVGLDEGVWHGEYDPETQMVRLPDDQYRTLLYARIAANHWDGTIPGAYAIWGALFPDSQIIIQDWQNMSMTVGIAGLPLNAVLRSLLTGGYIPLKPQGVRVDYYAVGTEAGPLLAFDAESEALAGFDIGQWPVELQPQQTTGVTYAS